ncbi:hypothetical protein C8F04DRAFT_1191467 [Mycena alexandri]|uniref:Uncharacterized protein n=1 Tax=Mycena alexandri TaxID=1745969 RepID=A0AAD6WVX9_9AGAR|nr:hypothetical protein C8F04DRAFT_1191467 [Mycena alexandri]
MPFLAMACPVARRKEWMPKGLDHRPYHPDFEDNDVVLDGMDEREFECSGDLEEYLREFYRKIKPFCVDLPTLCDVPDQDIPAIFARFRALEVAGQRDTLFAFECRVRAFVGERFQQLPPDARAQVSLPKLPPGITNFTYWVVSADMLSMRSELIELKVWVSNSWRLKNHRSEFVPELLLRYSPTLGDGNHKSLAASLIDLLCSLQVVKDFGTQFSNFLHRFSASRADDKSSSKRDEDVPQDSVPSPPSTSPNLKHRRCPSP